MPANLQKARELFLHAVGKLPPEQWEGYVASACGKDAELEQQLKDLLKVHCEAGSFLDRPAAAIGETGAYTLNQPQLQESPGDVIGPYKLLEQIGEGGFGVVFMAEQTEPVRRKVALKVLKPGMDTRQVVTRFEAERQALAIMDHPNIAHVYDGGQTPSGRPFFVMELVRGTPITEFCDQNQLGIRQRLDLFLNVCQAVQHAHQKGIIHRDIKPSNVMIASHDGTPVVKVIDFGIAKAMTGLLTDKTLVTGFAQMIGSPLYMSPEQAGQSSLDVDTRSDIYSLGVLLYELLTGTTPFDKEQLSKLGYDELRRIIREEEPQRPSTHISTLGKDATTASTNRKSEPRKLSQQVRGELDWIVMKALEKDRNRRYETANAFAADVQRYLNDETVEACPPSAGYRLRKLARRHRRTLVPAAVVALILVFATAVSIWQALEARQAQRQAEADRNRAETNFREAFWAIEHLLAVFDPDRKVGGVTVAELRQYQTAEALRFLNTFCAQSSDDPSIRLQQGVAYVHAGRIYQVLTERDKAQQMFRHAIAVFRRLVADFPEDPKYPRELSMALYILAADLHAAGRIQDANVCYAQSTAVLCEAVRQHPANVDILNQQASFLCTWFDPTLCDPRGALEPARKAVALAPDLPKSWLALGIASYRCGEWNAAEAALQKARELKAGDWTMAQIMCFLAMAQWRCQKQVEARESYEQAVRLMDKNFDARDLVLRAETASVLGIQWPPAPNAKGAAPHKE